MKICCGSGNLNIGPIGSQRGRCGLAGYRQIARANRRRQNIKIRHEKSEITINGAAPGIGIQCRSRGLLPGELGRASIATRDELRRSAESVTTLMQGQRHRSAIVIGNNHRRVPTTSGNAPPLLATNGTPQRIASSADNPNPSSIDTCAATSAMSQRDEVAIVTIFGEVTSSATPDSSIAAQYRGEPPTPASGNHQVPGTARHTPRRGKCRDQPGIVFAWLQGANGQDQWAFQSISLGESLHGLARPCRGRIRPTPPVAS